MNLSYSGRLTLALCPRKFELDKLMAVERDMEDEVAVSQNVTFAFGHIVGEGIQNALTGMTEEQVVWRMFLGWHADLMDVNEKQMKSFYYAVHAVQKFCAMRKAGLLDGYELLSYQGVPACELSFRISFPDGFKYRGYVDAVLRHKVTGKVLVLELKTTAMKFVNPATYKNSAQAIGYSIVLDVIAPDVSSYEVLYLVYLTKSMEYEILPFEKSFVQRALWIRELLLDIEIIKLFEEANVWPMHGQNCIQYGRECNYYGMCTMSNENLAAQIPATERVEEYQIELTLAQVVEAQFHKMEELMGVTA